MNKKVVFLLVAIFCLWILSFSAFASQVVDKIVAVVGDKFLTLYELNEMCKPYFEKFINPDLPEEEKERIKKDIQQKILRTWIEESVLEIEAKKYGLTVSDAEIENYLKAEINSLGGEEKFKNFLKSQGLTLEEYKKKLKDKLLKIKLVQIQIHQKVLVTQEELEKAYQEAIKHYDKSYKYWISVLIIKEDKLLSEAIFQEVLKGKSFEEIYKSNPQQVQLIKEEVFKKNELAPEILKKLKTLKPGEITEPIKIGNSYYIIKLIKAGFDRPPSFEKMKPQLYKVLFEKKAQKFIENWIKELEDKRYIKIYL